jgi:hypothetical protein
MTSRFHMRIAVAVAMIFGTLVWTQPGRTAQEQHKAQLAAQLAVAGYTSRDLVGFWTCQWTGPSPYHVTEYRTVRSDGTSEGYGTVNGHTSPPYEGSWSYAPSGPTTGTVSAHNMAGSNTRSVKWRSPNRYTQVVLTDTIGTDIGNTADCVRGQHQPSKDCAEVKQFIQESEHFRNEYNDPSLVAQAKKNHWTGGQFEDAVRAKDKADAKAIGNVGVEGAYTDENCVIHLNSAALGKMGLLQVEINSTLVHEKVHQSDCQNAKKNGTQDTWQSRQKMENDAYNADIAYLQKWVSANC